MNKFIFSKQALNLSVEDIERLENQSEIELVKNNDEEITVFTELPEEDVLDILIHSEQEANEDISEARRRSDGNRIGYMIYRQISVVQKLKRGEPDRAIAAASLAAAVTALYSVDPEYACRLVSQVGSL